MKSVVSTVLELLGLGAVVFGAWSIYEPAGWILAGAVLVFVGYSIGD